MASHLVNQHQQTSFATPINGAAGDATVVLGNDNATVTSYNAHDSDATIHTQDSSAAVFGATPAGTAGRKWLTNDADAVYAYFDTGAAWVEWNYLRNTGGTVTGNVAITGTATITSASASAFAVGLAGATNPSFVVDSSTGSQAAGLKVTGAVAAGTVAVAVISSGADANLTVNAKGTGTIGIGSVSTGRVTITPVCTITGALTQTGLATFNGGATIASGQTFTVTGATITGLTAASVGAGTFPAGAYVFASGGVTVTSGGLTVSAGTTAVQAATATTLGVTGAITRTATAAASTLVLTSTGSTTKETYVLFTNTTGSMYLGIESSAGNQLMTGSTAYATVLLSSGATVLQLGANDTLAVTFAKTGSGVASATFTGRISTLLTTEQMRLQYDSTHYIKTTVDASGNATRDIIGAGGIGHVFSINSTIAAQITDTGFSSSYIVITPATAAVAGAGLRLPHGTVPNSPVNGDLWTTSAGLYVRINGATVGPLS